MNTSYTTKVLCVAAFLGSASTVAAQEDHTKEKDLNREMTLEREYDPSVQDANKVNTLPVVKEPVARKIPIDYADFTVPTEPRQEISLLPSGNIMAQMDYNKRRGYFRFGGGTRLNLAGDLGYHILSTDRDRLNLFLSHRSTNGKAEYLQNEEKVKTKLNDNLGGIRFSHRFDKLDLSMGASYQYTGFNYYGLPFPLDSYPYVDKIATIADYQTQVNQTIHANLGVTSKADANVGYLFELGFTNFSHKYGVYGEEDGPKENTIEAQFDINSRFNGDMRAGLSGLVEFFNYSFAEYNFVDGPSQQQPVGYAFKDHAEFTLSPYWRMTGDSWNVQLGAHLMAASGNDAKFMASPNITAEVTVADKTQLYLNAGGKLYSNSLYETARINRYFMQTEELLPSRNWLDATAGLRCGAAPGFWFNLFGGYRITSDDVFFLPGTDVDGLGSLYGAVQYDSKQAFGGVSLKYSYQQAVDIRLQGTYSHWSVDKTDAAPGEEAAYGAWNKPEMEVTAGITIRPFTPLSLDLDYYLATGRKSFFWGESVKMDNINELNLTASYIFNETFGAYAKLSNLLFQKYEQYYRYPLQGFNAMVGVNINF